MTKSSNHKILFVSSPSSFASLAFGSLRKSVFRRLNNKTAIWSKLRMIDEDNSQKCLRRWCWYRSEPSRQSRRARLRGWKINFMQIPAFARSELREIMFTLYFSPPTRSLPRNIQFYVLFAFIYFSNLRLSASDNQIQRRKDFSKKRHAKRRQNNSRDSSKDRQESSGIKTGGEASTQKKDFWG